LLQQFYCKTAEAERVLSDLMRDISEGIERMLTDWHFVEADVELGRLAKLARCPVHATPCKTRTAPCKWRT